MVKKNTLLVGQEVEENEVFNKLDQDINRGLSLVAVDPMYGLEQS